GGGRRVPAVSLNESGTRARRICRFRQVYSAHWTGTAIGLEGDQELSGVCKVVVHPDEKRKGDLTCAEIVGSRSLVHRRPHSVIFGRGARDSGVNHAGRF